MQEEFDTLWSSPFAVRLADFVVRDLDRLSRRELIRDVARWRDAPDPDPASVVVEAPVYRKEVGLWEHQKHFVKLAFDAHRGPHGARFVLADQVGLGKTLQLAMAAQLMGPVRRRAGARPRAETLLRQWQDELDTLLGLPSAIWDGGRWMDEHGIEHPGAGAESIRRCPRRVGIVSTGLIIGNTEAAARLAEMRYECVILDEAHRGAAPEPLPREPGLRDRPAQQPPEVPPEISPRTKSLLLATATPVQLHPVEAYDLLDALAQGSHAVLGAPGSRWRNARASLDLLLGNAAPPADFHKRWDWLRQPLPAPLRREGFRDPAPLALAAGRGRLCAGRMPSMCCVRPTGSGSRADSPASSRVTNPYIRTIVLRTREYLENTTDPETGEPFLTPVVVRLHGESDEDAIVLPPFLEDAYAQTETFCGCLPGARTRGFFRTMLLRRMGSTMEAGRLTVARILDGWEDSGDEYGEDDDREEADDRLRTLTGEERGLLSGLAQAMEVEPGSGSEVRRRRAPAQDEGWLEHAASSSASTTTRRGGWPASSRASFLTRPSASTRARAVRA